MPDNLSPFGWRIPDSLGNDTFKSGFTAIRDLAADISASLQGRTNEVVYTFPTLASGWALGADGGKLTRVGRTVNFSCHLTRSGSTAAANSTIFTLPADCVPRQMQWFPGLKFGAIVGELKIWPSHNAAGTAQPATTGAVSLSIPIEAGSGAVLSATFLSGAWV